MKQRQFPAFAATAFDSHIRVTVLIEPESTLQRAPRLDWRMPDCPDALSGIVYVTIETRPKSKLMPDSKLMPERMLIPALDWRVAKTTK